MSRFHFRRGRILSFLCAASVVFLVAGCSTVEKRIREKPATFQALSLEDQNRVMRKEIREGFSKDAVYLAWGRPDRIERGFERGQPYETWVWFAYQDRPVGFYYDPFPCWRAPLLYPQYETYVYPWRLVTFVHNRVVAWRIPGL